MSNSCMIAATPDVSGFGVRLSIYLQSLLCLIPPVLVVLSKWPSQTALDLSERLTTTNLILAFAILGSSLAQALNNGLANYHAHIALKLGWLTVFNLATFFWMYMKFSQHKHLNRSHSILEVSPSSERNEGETKSTLLKRIVILLGGAFMMAVGFFGIWLWQEPEYFGPTSTLCATNSVVIRMPLLWNLRIALGSSSLRACYLVLYGVFLAVVAPLLVLATLSPGSVSSKLVRRTASKGPKTLICLALLSLSTILEIEATMKENEHLQSSYGNPWDFGQVLAAMVIMVPVRDILRALHTTGVSEGANAEVHLPRHSSDLKQAEKHEL